MVIKGDGKTKAASRGRASSWAVWAAVPTAARE